MGWVVRRLAPVRHLLCASPCYLVARGVPAAPDDLTDHQCPGFTGHRFWPDWPLRRGAERVTVRPNGPLMSGDGEALPVAAAGGAGIMPASDWLVGRELADGRLLEVLPSWSAGDSSAVPAVLPPGRLVPGKTRVFLEWIARVLAPVSPWRTRHVVTVAPTGPVAVPRRPV